MRAVFTAEFEKRLRKKEPRQREAVKKCVKRLLTDRDHPGLNIHKMRGRGDIWEAYVDKGNRVTFQWEGDTFIFRVNCNHDILRKP